MNGVAVYGVDVALFVVVKDTVSPEGARTNNVLYYVSFEVRECSMDQLTRLVRM